jgi:hypothetical protein
MKTKISICIIIGSLCFSTGCDSLLDVEPVSNITNANYWKAEGDVEGYLVGVYSDFRAVMNSTYYLEDRGDSFVVGLESGVSSAWQHNLTPTNAPNWIEFYNLIHHCNLILKHAPSIAFADEHDRDRILAETHFLRAHTYFTLLRSWGDVPLVLEPTESDNRPLPARASAADVMEQVLADIAQALALFPEPGFVDKTRASAPAAHALKADALLWKFKVLQGTEADLQGVITAVDNASPGLTLEGNFADIFDTNKKNGKEIIFALHFKRDEKSDHYSSRLKPRDLFVNSAVNKSALPYARSGARSAYAPSPKLETLLNTHANDQRKNASMITAIGSGNTVIGIFDNKMRGTAYSDDRYFENDLVIYRLSEMIIFKAEALAALNRPDEAITELDKVRARAGTGAYTGAKDKASVEKEILDERFREFYLELKRWPDLVRFHHAGTIDVYNEVPNIVGSVPVFFPIPQAQIDLNPNLVQTEGYE